MSGKRGRGDVTSKAKRNGSDDSYNKYFNSPQGKKARMKATKEDMADTSLNKKWIKENLKQNKDYESVNKLKVRGKDHLDTYKEAKKMGISTAKLERVASRSNNPQDFNEYGFKPHVQTVVNQVKELTKGGYMPNAKLTGFGVGATTQGTFAQYNNKTKEYLINLNALSIPRIHKAMQVSKAAGKNFSDVVTHELGHAVYHQNKVANRTITKNGKKVRAKRTQREQAVRNAYAKLYREIRKNTNSNNLGSLSSYSGNVNAKRKKAVKGSMERKSLRRSVNSEAFAEGYVNYYRYKSGKTKNLHPVGKAVGNFLKEINSINSRYR